MALWNQRDTRWIVQDREDGTNVNSWHWQEKNRMSWAKERLNELLQGIEATFEAPSTSGQEDKKEKKKKKKKIRVASVSSVEGDASQSTRKGGKKMSCYDLKLELSWVSFDDEGSDDDGGGGGEEEEGKKKDGDGGDSSGGDDNDNDTKKKRKNEIKGNLKVLEVTTGHDEDDIHFEATVTGVSRELSPREAADALRRPVLDAIAAFASELEALEL